MEDNDCLFCNFISGKFSTPGIFWEDENHMAFLTIFPVTPGHTVVIPKKHFWSDVLKMPEKNLSDLVCAAKKVAKKIEDHFPDVGRVGLIMEGMGINHAHIKLVPMHGTGYLKKWEWKEFLAEPEFFESYPGYLSSHDGPQASDEEIADLAEKLKNNS